MGGRGRERERERGRGRERERERGGERSERERERERTSKSFTHSHHTVESIFCNHEKQTPPHMLSRMTMKQQLLVIETQHADKMHAGWHLQASCVHTLIYTYTPTCHGFTYSLTHTHMHLQASHLQTMPFPGQQCLVAPRHGDKLATFFERRWDRERKGWGGPKRREVAH